MRADPPGTYPRLTGQPALRQETAAIRVASASHGFCRPALSQAAASPGCWNVPSRDRRQPANQSSDTKAVRRHDT